MILHCLQTYNLYLRPEKCEFEQAKVDYLGLVISHAKVSMDPVKIEAIVNWPIPESLKEIQSFIGFANFYRQFIKDFSVVETRLDTNTREQSRNLTTRCWTA
jgi:hypothetical protein